MYINFHYPSSGKILKFLKNNKKFMKFAKNMDRDEVLKKVQDTYNIPMIER